MSLVKRTGSNIGWVLISDIATKGATVFATIYLARVLGVVEFGIFSLGVALASSLWPLVDFGATGYGTREVAHDKSHAKQIISSLNSMRLMGSVIVLIFAYIIFQFQDMDSVKQWALICGLLYLIGYSISPDWVIRGIERMKYLAVINFVTVFIFVIGTIIIVHSPDEVIEASFIRSFSFLAGSIAGLVILALNTDIRFRPVIDFNHWFELARKTYIFLFNRLATNLGQFAPFYAVTILYADEIVGLFAASHRLYIIALTALFAVTSAVYPILSDLARNKPEQLVEYQQKLIQFLAFLFIPTGLFCMVFSDDIMRFLFGDKYIDASFSAGLLLLALPVVAIKTIYVFSLLGSRMETRALQVNVVGVVLQLFLAILLVPSYNLTGAASMMLIGEFMAMCLAYYYCLTLLGSMRLIDSVVVRICVISFVVVLIAYALNIKLIWTALLSATLYLVLSPVVGIVPQSFLRKLKS